MERFEIDGNVLRALIASEMEEGEEFDHYNTSALSNLFDSAFDDTNGAPAITCPTIGGNAIEAAVYDSDDEESAGFLLGVRPRGIAPWFPAGMQIASTWQETWDAFPGDDDDSPTAVYAAVVNIIDQANEMLPYLAKLAGEV
jgi:hypothetical protein